LALEVEGGRRKLAVELRKVKDGNSWDGWREREREREGFLTDGEEIKRLWRAMKGKWLDGDNELHCPM